MVKCFLLTAFILAVSVRAFFAPGPTAHVGTIKHRKSLCTDIQGTSHWTARQSVRVLPSKRFDDGTNASYEGGEDYVSISTSRDPDVRANLGLLSRELLVTLVPAAAFSALLHVNPFENVGLSAGDVGLAVTIAVAGQLLDKVAAKVAEGSAFFEPAIESFKRVELEDQAITLRLFGLESKSSSALLFIMAESAAAGVGEEILFRGVLQRALTLTIGPYLAAVSCGVLFGVLHGSRSSYFAAAASVYGIIFGAIFCLTGGNVAAAILCHSLYDIISFSRSHASATKRFAISEANAIECFAEESLDTESVWPDTWSKALETRTRAVYHFVDVEKRGTVNRKEVEQGLIALGKAYVPDEVSEITSKVDSDGDGQLTYTEFRSLVAPKQPVLTGAQLLYQNMKETEKER